MKTSFYWYSEQRREEYAHSVPCLSNLCYVPGYLAHILACVAWRFQQFFKQLGRAICLSPRLLAASLLVFVASPLLAAFLRSVFTSDGVEVEVVIRTAGRNDLVKIKTTELDAGH